LNLLLFEASRFFYLGLFTTNYTIASTTATTAIFSFGVISGLEQIMMEHRRHGRKFENANGTTAFPQQIGTRAIWITAFRFYPELGKIER